jgi:hypothetical protein
MDTNETSDCNGPCCTSAFVTVSRNILILFLGVFVLAALFQNPIKIHGVTLEFNVHSLLPETRSMISFMNPQKVLHKEQNQKLSDANTHLQNVEQQLQAITSKQEI